MRDRLLTAVVIAGAIAAVSMTPAVLGGQTPKATTATSKSGASIPRTPDGKPDLTGMYDIATMTPVERAAGTPLVLPDEQAATLEQQAAATRENLAAPIAADRGAPPVGGDGTTGAKGNVGGYNNFWIDAGSRFNVVDGRKRASIVIDPPDGRVPAMKPEARQRMVRNVRPTSDQSAREDDPGFEGGGAYDDPERRPLGERCLLGFASTSGPPALPNYFYNNLHQIVQSKDTVMILTEMVHDARIVRMNAEHAPPTIRKWMGDSVGHWESDTLVVDTTNFTDKTRFRGATENLHVVERFTRVDAKTLRYRFTIEDASVWATPWTGEYTWPATDELMYEYACHEANYAMGNILRGARLKEANDAKKTRQ